MNRNPDLDQMLDQAVDEIRDARLDPEQERAAAESTLALLRREAAEHAEPDVDSQRIADCADFQALIPAFLRDGLNDAKSLLVEDHVSECLPCRKAMKQAKNELRGVQRRAAAPTQKSWTTKWSWRIAAAAVILLAVIGTNVKTDLFTIRTGGMIRVQNLSGEVFQVTDQGNVPVVEGQQISFADVTGLRTGKDARALLTLEDGSSVEMNERAELAVKNRRGFLSARNNSDAVIELTRGNIIVEASEQGSGHLYVDTSDCDVAVTGTVFAVNTGIKGSRISVIEGEVLVAYRGNEDVLHPGQQSTTRQGLGRVPVTEEISWSQNVDRHIALLTELTKVSEEIDAVLASPGLRYDTSLLDLSPDETVVYVGVPNVSESLGEAYDLLLEKVASNDVLQDWWNRSVVEANADDEIERAMNLIRDFGEQLDDEIALTLQVAGNEVQEPIILGRLTQPAAFAGFVREQMQSLAEGREDAPTINVIEQDLVAADPDAEVYFWINGDRLAVAFDLQDLNNLANAWQRGGGGFNESDFHNRLADLYRDGVQLVVGVDVATLTAMNRPNNESDENVMEEMGLLDLQHVIGERKEKGDLTENRVVLTFDEPRKGLASWLAEPAPMGALDFVSQDATLAVGFVMREPSAVVEEMLDVLGGTGSELTDRIREFEEQQGISIVDDLAASLGGEFAFALDGPVVPIPSWKLVIEVYNPEQLQATLSWAVQMINQGFGPNFEGFEIRQHNAGGRIYFELESLDTGLSAHFTFVDGYLLAGPSRALLDMSIRTRASGLTLTDSGKFRALLPRDREVNFSAAAYQNLTSLMGPLGTLGSAVSEINPEQADLLKRLGEVGRPSLTLAYGEDQAITFVHNNQGGFLASSLGVFLRLETLTQISDLLQQAERNQYDGSPVKESEEGSDVDVRIERETTSG